MDRKTEMTPWKDLRPDKYHAQDAKTSTSRHDIRFVENSPTIFFLFLCSSFDPD